MAHNRPTTAPPMTAEKAKVERLVIGYFDPGDPGSNPSRDKKNCFILAVFQPYGFSVKSISANI